MVLGLLIYTSEYLKINPCVVFCLCDSTDHIALVLIFVSLLVLLIDS